ncbi:Predicted O-methyltransferase YrrM [Pararobbsia alpina]|uniref:O-methyltransferase n=1 Tax=Pararobbsia alpina TaxID=621374 RepID=UPI0039A57F57
MNTLTQQPVSTVLATLFADADATDALLRQQLSALSKEERDAFMQDAKSTNFKTFYGRAKDFHLAVSKDTAHLLYMLARSSNARTVVEFGTSFGVSTVHIAAALRDNGGGRLITTEFEPSKVAAAQRNLTAAGLVDLVEFREGDALVTLASALPDTIDLVLLDGAKALYPEVLRLLEPKLRAGGAVIADNADWCPEYLDYVRTSGRYLSVPFASDVEFSIKLGPYAAAH